MKDYRRPDRLAQFIRKEVGAMLLTEGHRDELTRVVLTDCRVTGDLRLARLYYTLLGDPQDEAQGDPEAARRAADRALAAARGGLRHRLGQLLHTRYTPELVFLYDETLQTARRIEALIQELGPAPAPDEDPEGSKE